MAGNALRVGFLGAGFVAHFHSRAIEQVRDLEIAGIFSPEGAIELSESVKKRGLGPAKVYSSVSELANQVDAIAIFCPNKYRVSLMEQIAAAKRKGAAVKGVICEKPLGRNLAEARRLVELAGEAGLLTAYFENQIFMKCVQVQKQQLLPQEKNMGPLHLVRSAEEHGGPHSGWFWDPTEQGGGVLSDMGCHSIAVGWYFLTPTGKPLTYLRPRSVSCDLGLLKWGQPQWRERLLKEKGVDYRKVPAEDFATGTITFENPENGQRVKSQFTDSWMFEKQGLRLLMDGMGPGYAFEINSLVSPLTIFIGDEAAQAVADSELALEKSTASRGLLAVQPNEADLYGYVDEFRDVVKKFGAGKDGFLPLSYGLEITKLVMASYLASETRRTIDLTDSEVEKRLESYVPLIQQGKGADVLL